MTIPSIGRIVHYTSYGSAGGEYASTCRAATVTEINGDDTIGLCVMNPEGLFFNSDVVYSDANRGGTWHWPERV